MSVRQRLYPAATQVPVLVMHCAHTRFIYNLALEQRRYWTRGMTQSVNRFSQQKDLVELRAEHDWLRAGSSSVQQGALRDVDTAFTNFFRKTARYPRYKNKRSKQSFLVRDLKIQRLNKRNAQVLIPKLGYVRFRLSYSWVELTHATSARVSFRNDQWHVSFTTAPRRKHAPTSQKIVGVDRGCANTLATSERDMLHIPVLTSVQQQRFIWFHQKLAQQTKGSHRRDNTMRQLHALYRKLGDRRTNWIEQTTTTLAKTYQSVVLEKLATTNMVRKPQPKPDPHQTGHYLPNGRAAKAALNKAIYASCWGKLGDRLEHKTTVHYINPRNTSQQCHQCGHIGKENRESQAVFRCTQCAHTNHADINAALNIRDRYLHPGTQGNAPKNANHLAA